MSARSATAAILRVARPAAAGLLCAVGLDAARAADPREAELLALYRDSKKLITARRLAEELLAEDPDSVTAHYVLGCVLREAEGDHAKAIYHLGLARELAETSELGQPEVDALHPEILHAVQLTAGEMDLYDYQLQILDWYDYKYDPDLAGEHVWPLMKLGRYDEAREFGRRAVASTDPWTQTVGRTGLCALEFAAANREGAYTACQDALVAQRPSRAVTVEAYNAAMAAWATLRFAEVRTLLGEAARAGEYGAANPWRPLAELELGAGKGEAAVAAMTEMKTWTSRQPPESRDQNRAEADAALAKLLLVAGETSYGLEVADRMLRFPDRRGTTSGRAAEALGGHALIRIALRRADRETWAEDASSGWFWERWGAWFGDLLPDFDDWSDRQTVAGVLSDEATLTATLRVYAEGALAQVPTWMLGELVDVLGPGVVGAALVDVRAQEPDPRFVAYYDAVAAEVALASGDDERATAFAVAARDALPGEEALLRARLAGILAASSADQGLGDDEIRWLAVALAEDPSVLRRLDLQLPAEVVVEGGHVAGLVGDQVWRSPRIRWAKGWTIRVAGEGREVDVCLIGPDGARGRCVRPPADAVTPPDPSPDDTDPPVPLSDEEFARALVRAWHRETFAMPLGSASTSLHSLDATNLDVSEARRAETNALLEGLVREDAAPR